MAIDSVSDIEHGLTRRLTEAGFSVFAPGSDGMPSLVAAHPSFGLIAIDLVDHAERAGVELNRKVARLRIDVPEVDRVRTHRVVVAGDLDTSDGDMITGTDAAAGSFLRDLPDRPMEQAAIDALATFFAPRVSIEVPRRRPMADEDAADRAKQRLLLDATQSAIARREVDDVLVVTGPPGSGKTLVLAARAKWLAAQHPGWRIVFLCYNRLLVPYLELLVWGHANISVHTFGKFTARLRVRHAPEDVSEHYPGVNRGLLRECRILVLAMITTWRWDRGDQLPNGRQLGTDWLSQIRAALERKGLDTHG